MELWRPLEEECVTKESTGELWLTFSLAFSLCLQHQQTCCFKIFSHLGSILLPCGSGSQVFQQLSSHGYIRISCNWRKSKRKMSGSNLLNVRICWLSLMCWTVNRNMMFWTVSWAEKRLLVKSLMIWLIFQQKCQIFAGFNLLNVRIFVVLLVCK